MMRTRSVYALTVAALALVAHVAQAQVQVHPPYTSQTYQYRDSDGTGRMTITDLGSASGTVFDLLQVTLVQGNTNYSGSGYSMHISPNNPTEALFFSLSDHRGNSYVFTGTLSPGTGGVSGGGTYHAEGFPRWTNAWRIEGIASPIGSTAP
jgi:hypothetical protein